MCAKEKGNTLRLNKNIPNTTKCEVEYALKLNHVTYEGHEYATFGSLSWMKRGIRVYLMHPLSCTSTSMRVTSFFFFSFKGGFESIFMNL